MHWFSRYSIRKQFRIILVGLISLCLLLGGICYTAIDRLMTQNAASYAQNTTQRFTSEVQYLCKRVDALFNSLLFDPNIERLMLQPYSPATPAYIKSLQVQFSSFSIMNEDITDIALVTDEFAWSSYFETEMLNRFFKHMNEEYGVKSFGLQTSSVHRHSENSPQLVFGHSVYGMHDDAQYGKFIGCVFLSLDLSKSALSLPVGDGRQTAFLLLDAQGQVFPFNATKETGDEILAQYHAFGKEQEPFMRTTKDYILYETFIPESGFSLLSAIDRHALNRDVLHTTLWMVLIVLGALSIVLVLMRTILQNMVTPLGTMAEYLALTKTHPPDAPLVPLALDGCAEIRSVSCAVDEMFTEQNRLMNELHNATVTLYETELGKKQAELDFLRSQINPHFLYNTLETMQDIATEHGVNELAQIASAMGTLFRYNVKGESTVALAQEMEITRAYLAIQQARFPSRFEIIYSIRANTLSCPVMKLLFQPLVENAIVHGLEPKNGQGTLYIGAKTEEDALVLSVYDDGIGMPPAQLEALRESLHSIQPATAGSGHIGLLNVQHRILLQYGSGWGIALESVQNEGTQITVKIPLVQEGELSC